MGWQPNIWAEPCAQCGAAPTVIYRNFRDLALCAACADPYGVDSNGPELARQAGRLRAALADAAEGLEEMLPYVPAYYRTKWGHGGYVRRAREALEETAPEPPCFAACDTDCEVGPRHSRWLHEPAHKPGWHQHDSNGGKDAANYPQKPASGHSGGKPSQAPGGLPGRR